MSIRTAVIFLLSIIGILFLAVNWSGIVAPVPVNLLYTQIEAPLGLIVLVILGVLWVAAILWSLMQQASILVEIRRAYKEAQTNKNLAENAELSRTERLTRQMTSSFDALEKKNATLVDNASLAHAQEKEALMKEVATMKEELTYTKKTLEAIAAKLEVPLPEKEGKKVTFFERLKTKKSAKGKALSAPKTQEK